MNTTLSKLASANGSALASPTQTRPGSRSAARASIGGDTSTPRTSWPSSAKSRRHDSRADAHLEHRARSQVPGQLCRGLSAAFHSAPHPVVVVRDPVEGLGLGHRAVPSVSMCQVISAYRTRSATSRGARTNSVISSATRTGRSCGA
ncbi:hypothetical protein SVIOM342S_05273 [Streptomyces violaceorubidus]